MGQRQVEAAAESIWRLASRMGPVISGRISPPSMVCFECSITLGCILHLCAERLTERMTARVFREAGACVRQNVPRTRSKSKSWLKTFSVTAAFSWLWTTLFVAGTRGQEATYPELALSGRCKLVALVETRDRWSWEAVHSLLQMPAHSKA